MGLYHIWQWHDGCAPDGKDCSGTGNGKTGPDWPVSFLTESNIRVWSKKNETSSNFSDLDTIMIRITS